MNRSIGRLGLGVGLLLALAPLRVAAAGPPAHAHAGADKCKTCHNSPAKGAQFTRWIESKHAKAHAALASEEPR